MLTFERFLDDFFAEYFMVYPEQAIHYGVAGFDHLAQDFSNEAYKYEKEFWKRSLKALSKVRRENFTPDEEIDYTLMQGKIIITNYELAKEDYRLRQLGVYLPFSHIYELTVKPTNDVAGNILSQLRAFPGTLMEAMYNFTFKKVNSYPPSLWVRMAMGSAKSGAKFLDSLPENPAVKNSVKDPAEFGEAIERAKTSADVFYEFLKRDVYPLSVGSYAVGGRHYDLLLKNKHFLEMEADDLFKMGSGLFNETKKELKKMADKMYPGKSIQEAAAKIHDAHPEAGALLNAYAKAMQRARDFVKENNLVTFPPAEELKVVWTPEFQRHEIPFAAYSMPSLSDPLQRGYYYVTPAENDETLGEHNWAGLENTSVHESYPGHHLQFTVAHSIPAACTFPRIMCESSVMYEGWALYCEELMQEQGFLRSESHKFIMLKDRLWRALRIKIDVQTQRGEMIYDEAADLMEQELCFPRSQASADLNWYSQAPSVPMGYALGWSMIKELRQKEMVRLGSKFNLREFHDKFLSCGSIAVPLIIKRHFRD